MHVRKARLQQIRQGRNQPPVFYLLAGYRKGGSFTATQDPCRHGQEDGDGFFSRQFACHVNLECRFQTGLMLFLDAPLEQSGAPPWIQADQGRLCGLLEIIGSISPASEFVGFWSGSVTGR